MAEYRFGEFLLNPEERLLRRGDQRIELSGRYLDALSLMVREAGKLLSKDRLHDEVWHGVPVTDEALTQCIRSLRRVLGDKADAPRFIETVPKHGYRFIAPVETDRREDPVTPQPTSRESDLPWLFAAGVVGAGLAGLAGGLVYGLAATSAPGTAGQMGTLSVLLVLLCVTTLTAILGGAGVVAGLVVAEAKGGLGSIWLVAGGAIGGLLVGTVTKLLGVDAFNLLLGRAPEAMTGGGEGLLLGAATGLAAMLTARLTPTLRASAAASLVIGAMAGGLTALLGGQLMAGSLDSFARTMSGSRLRLDGLGMMLGEGRFGTVSRMVMTSAEAALFTGAIVTAMGLARRQRGSR